MRLRSLGQIASSALHPPLWARWVLTILGFVVFILAIRAFVHSNDGSSGPTQSERAAEVEANREGQVVIEEDQAPHTSPLRSDIPARVALERAIAIDAGNRIRTGQLAGPLQGVRCGPAGPQHAGRLAFSCRVRAAGISYPFLGVLHEPARQLTWCKVDPPPVSGAPEVPVSPRCRA